MEQKKNPNIFEVWDNTVQPILRKAVRFWYIPIVAAVLMGLISYYSESRKDANFSAKITFMLEDDILGESQQAAGGQLLMALSGQKNTNSKAVMVDLGMSNKLVEETLLRSVTIDSQKILLGNYYIDHCGPRKAWKKDGNKAMEKFRFPKNYRLGSNKDIDFLLRQYSNQIKLSLRSQVMESGLIVMNFSSNNELFTKVFLENHLLTIGDFYIDKKTERTLNLIAFAQRKKDSLQALLTGKTFGLANMQDQGFGTVMRRAKVPELQVTRDIGILTQQYNESVVALSGASIDLERQRPFITVVDDIRLPLDATWPKPMNKAITMAVLSLFLVFAAISFLFVGLDYLSKQKMAFENDRN